MPLAVLSPLEFLYVLQYAPNLASRLYYVHYTERDSTFRGLRDFRRWFPVIYNAPLVARSFIDAHPRFYVFCDDKQIENLNNLGRMASVTSLKATEDHVLLQMERNSSTQTTPQKER